VYIGDLLDQGAVCARVGATSKRQVLSVIAEVAARNFGVEASDVLAKLLAREQLGSTGVGYGVAVPHARMRGLDRMRGVFLRLEAPVEFGAVDDQPVDLIFALLAPCHSRSCARPICARSCASRVLPTPSTPFWPGRRVPRRPSARGLCPLSRGALSRPCEAGEDARRG
jgi:mannitol/fructose-specific phosphotransferase system IIA component (Ntr-type)